MIVVVLSDTHASDLSDLPARIVDDTKKAELIIHAGDYTSRNLLDQLRDLADFRGVHGNMDPYEIKSELPDKAIVEIQGFKIGITHPSEGGSPFGLKRRAKSKLAEELDVIIYGHSHTPMNEQEGSTLYFNPGSATGMFPARYKSYGIVRIITDTIKGEIVKI